MLLQKVEDCHKIYVAYINIIVHVIKCTTYMYVSLYNSDYLCVDCVTATNCDECAIITATSDFNCQWCSEINRLVYMYTYMYMYIINIFKKGPCKINTHGGVRQSSNPEQCCFKLVSS